MGESLGECACVVLYCLVSVLPGIPLENEMLHLKG